MTGDRAISLLAQLRMDLYTRIADTRKQPNMRDSERAMTITLYKEQQEAIDLAMDMIKKGARTK